MDKKTFRFWPFVFAAMTVIAAWIIQVALAGPCVPMLVLDWWFLLPVSLVVPMAAYAYCRRQQPDAPQHLARFFLAAVFLFAAMAVMMGVLIYRYGCSDEMINGLLGYVERILGART